MLKLHASVQYWKINKNDIADTFKLVKRFIYDSLIWDGSSSYTLNDYIWLGENEEEEKSRWGAKMIEKLLLTIKVADP